MKKTISVLLVLAMMLATVIAMVPTSAVDANATAITDEAGFLAMEANGNYYLNADIELTEIYNASKFAGTLDGNGKTITLSGAKACFNEVNGATIKNLTVEGDVVLTGSTDAAGVAVYGYGTFTNITNKANLSVTLEGEAKMAGKIGGIIAVVNGTTEITQCTNQGSITITTNGEPTDHYIGGIVGATDGGKMGGRKLIVNNCTNSGAISSNQAKAYLGGMIGNAMNVRLEMSQCTNSGAISVKQQLITNENKNSAYTGIGGMIGGTNQGGGNSGLSVLLTDCSNTAALQCTNVVGELVSCVFIGGMIGRGLHNNKFRAINCTNSGNITVPDFDQGWSGAGGMIGCMMTIGMTWAGAFDGKGNGQGETIMENCKNTGAISGKEAGGMWGSVYQMYLHDQVIKLQYCVNEGAINGTNNAGGLIGLFGSGETLVGNFTIKNCWNKGNVTATGRAAGIIATLEKIGTKGIPTIDSCISTGTIKTTSTSADAGVGIAAGILGFMPQYCSEFDDSQSENHKLRTSTTEAVVEIKGCVVGGAIQKTGSDNDRVAISLVNNNISTSAQAPNYYLSGISTNVNFGTAKNSTEINNLANGIKTSVASVGKLESAIANASGFEEIDYTEASWTAYQNALAAAKEVLTQYETLDQGAVDTKEQALTAAIAGLTLAPIDASELQSLVDEAKALDKKGFTSISFLRVTNALKTAEAALAQDRQSVVNAAVEELTDALDRLDPVEADDEDDDTTGGNTTGGDNTTGGNNAAGNNAATDAPATDAPVDEEEGGCGSAITATAVVLTTVLALGAGVAFKKKED